MVRISSFMSPWYASAVKSSSVATRPLKPKRPMKGMGVSCLRTETPKKPEVLAARELSDLKADDEVDGGAAGHFTAVGIRYTQQIVCKRS